MGFYEPLHERLAYLTPYRLATLRSNAWPSRHPPMTPPYFAEYAQLLGRVGFPGLRIGVAGTSENFAFDRFFMDERGRHPELLAYIQSLCDAAARAGRRPVLKFTRSQGRFSWFARHFPEHRHVLLLRQPWGQFVSAWHCLAEDENPYFLATPFMVLERNAHAPAAARLIAALELPVRPRPAPLRAQLTQWKRAVRVLPPAMLYRGALALWLLNAASGLRGAEWVIDGDSPSAEIADCLGLRTAIPQRPPPALPHGRPAMGIADVRLSHALALGAMAGALESGPSQQLARWLEASEARASRDLAANVMVREPIPAPGLLRRLKLGAA
jgi:hypothetical protein